MRWKIARVLSCLAVLATPNAATGESLDQFGQHHDLVAQGTYTVVDFAAAWCEPCYQALPELQALAREHPAIRFLVVSVDDEARGRDQLVEDLALRLPVIWDDQHQLIERFGPEGFPATYVLDSSGEIVYHHLGFSKKKWQSIVELLAELDVPSPGASNTPSSEALGTH